MAAFNAACADGGLDPPATDGLKTWRPATEVQLGQADPTGPFIASPIMCANVLHLRRHQGQPATRWSSPGRPETIRASTRRVR